ncbi:Protein prenyltransferase alpha subunit repeat [Seminavis robusta]|uniref:Protein prenyltransferase alpha subunit repeat n=1 Tax=Seminavis robusta TaxID=568900 RepID=A0A9N8E886_9STRA|nr:Protein prenyltransferase alpha subunit repeat [Seminavis robusta]|eukprot:Sro777_g201070.1 Protein prenyltransferase alpha subunit repeat (340) ;mRNA; r:38181-39200
MAPSTRYSVATRKSQRLVSSTSPTINNSTNSRDGEQGAPEGNAKKRGLPITSTADYGDDDADDPLADRILQGLTERADKKTKAWFTNYVKGTIWIGCKVPVVRSTIQQILKQQQEGKTASTRKTKKSKAASKQSPVGDSILMDNAICLLQHQACDAKLAGMILLSEHYPRPLLASHETLDRFDRDLWKDPTIISDWSTADWFSNKVLGKIVFHDHVDNSLQQRVFDYAHLSQASLWQRRCGIVPFLQYHKHSDAMPPDFGAQLMGACEANLLTSPRERFTQTGIAWVLRYVLLLPSQDGQLALDFICRHGAVWTTEAKKSFCEKLPKSDPRRKKILGFS